MTIAASAQNYEDGSVVVKASDQPVNLLLKIKKEVSQVVPGPGVKTPALSGAVGAWEVKVGGDLSLKRVRSGAFDFSTMPDGRNAVAARIELDGSTMQLNGFATRQGDRI